MEQTEKINISDYLKDGVSQKVLHKLKLGGEDYKAISKRIIFFTMISWLPLFILSIIESTAINPAIKIPLLFDFVLYIRVFGALPLLFVAERVVRFITFKSLSHFIESGIVADNNIDDYKKNLKFLGNLKDHWVIDVLTLILAYSIVIFGWGSFWKSYEISGSQQFWQFSTDPILRLSLTGYWYAFITIPIFIFFLFKNIWKFLLWAVFLFKISLMKLNLFPTDPDRTGGLAFLGYTQVFFGIIGFIQNVILSAEIAGKVIYTNEQLMDYKFTIIGIVVLDVIIFLIPMSFFVRKLMKTKLNGIMEYGVISHQYVSSFHKKWVNGINPKDDEFLGSGDIQSLADLSNSYSIIAAMSSIPISVRHIITLVLIFAAPFLPLVLLVIPVNEIFNALVKFMI